MTHRFMKAFYILLLTISFGGVFTVAHSQMTGPTTVYLNSTTTYTAPCPLFGGLYASGASYYWLATNGTLVMSGGNANVTWTTVGTGQVTYYFYGYATWSGSNKTTVPLCTLYPTVLAGPAVPNATIAYTYNCGSTTVTQTNPVPATEQYEWWWQTSNNGTSTTLGKAASLAVTNTNTLYLRARLKISPFTWSTTSQNIGSPTIYTTPPAAPTVANHASGFINGAVTLSVGAVSGAASYKWYNTASGGTAIAGATTSSYTISSLQATQTLYVSSLNAGGCESTTRLAVIATLVTPQITLSSGSPNVIMGQPVSLTVNATYTTYQWYKNGVQISGATAQTLATNQPGTYKVDVTKTGWSGTGTSPDFIVNSGFTGQVANYIVSNTILKKNILTQADIDPLTVSDNAQEVIYFDGLGRPIQKVVTQASPTLKDIVQPIAYDVQGREEKKYLPFTYGGDGWYKPNALADPASVLTDPELKYRTGEQYKFYQVGGDRPADQYPYMKTVFEPSPMNRALEQGATGAVWQPDAVNSYASTDATNKFAYQLNDANEVLKWTYAYPTTTNLFGTISASNNGVPIYYNASELYRSKTKDAQGNEVIEYVNREGKIVLKRVKAVSGAASTTSDAERDTKYTSTYYIYDDYYNLICVLQPEGVRTLSTDYFPIAKTEADRQAFLRTWAFRYRYDVRKRLTHKQLPGVDSVAMVYDQRDRLVLTQDGKQRAAKQWLYTKYDNLNRPIMSGIYTHATVATQAAMRDALSTTVFFETYNGVAATHGYTATVALFPSTNLELLSATYYDTYDFVTPVVNNGSTTVTTYNYTLNELTGQYEFDPTGTQKNYPRTFGLATGSKTNVMGTATYLYAVAYYDNRYRPIQNITQHHKSGWERVTNNYDFPGRVLETKTTHTTASNTYTTKRRFEYDHASRIKKTWHTFHNQPEVLLVQNTYNELGQLVTKRTHSRDNGTTFAQKTDYRYNIRGWLNKINDTAAPEASDLFSMDLNYNTPTANGGAAQFNGNISEMIWTSAGNEKQSYGYSYDALNRLTEAKFYNLARPLLNGRYTERIMGPSNTSGYDLNGNIKYLQRYGKKDNLNLGTSYGLVDDLTYNYVGSGNRLNKVDDAIATNVNEDGLKESVKNTVDYTYDVNGNLTKDDNKGITAIAYNYLNLPVQVNKGATDYMIYTYDATGRKLTQQVFGATPKTTDYIGEFVYENNVIAFVAHEEGRIVADNSVGAPRPWEYQYYLTDHLGNVRVSFSEKKTTNEYKATMEDATQSQEQSDFKGYKNRSPLPIFNQTPGGTYSQVLNGGGTNNQVGLAKSIAVNQGDVVDMEVYAKYEAATTTSNTLNTLFTALAGAGGFALNPSGGTGIDGQQAYNAFNSVYGAGPIINSGNWESSVAPKAYLNYILFDENFVLVDFGFDQIGTNGEQVGVSPVTAADYLNLHVKVKQKGYLYIYVSNENPVVQNVYFDEFKIVHNTGVEQINNYYAFGLTQASNSFEKPNLVNQPIGYNGKELQDELNLGWNDYGARMYDAAIGRWMVADPLAELSSRWSTYNYAYNNPVRFIDPDGMLPDETVGADGLTNSQWVNASRQGEDPDLANVDSDDSNSSSNTKKTAGPTPAEAARIAAHVYGGYEDSFLIGGWKKSKKQIKYVRWNDEHVTGLNSALYERTLEDGTKEYVYATAGTADFKDVIEDISQPVGVTAQYNLSVQNALLISKDVGAASLTFVGHSLGGGEAAANSYATGRNAMTFNAAGVSKENVKRYSEYNKSQKSGQIDAYILITDPLNRFQDKNHLLVPTVNGRREYYAPASFNGWINGHSIDNLIKAIDKRDKERKK